MKRKEGWKSKGTKFDKGKSRWWLFPFDAVDEIVQVMNFGAKKYGDFNWQKVEPWRERYFSACIRHLKVWQGGEKKDPETGFSHLAHAGCCIIFMLWREKRV